MKRAFLLILALLLVGGALVGFIRYREALTTIVTDTFTNETFTFAVIGDTEANLDLYEQALTEAKEQGATFLIHAGDITENGTEDEFETVATIAERAGLTVYATVGNHDIATDETRSLFTTYLNDVPLAFDAGGMRFVLLDNADRTIGFTDETLGWLTNDVAQHPAAHYVIIFHRPFDIPLGSIIGDDETAASTETNERFKSILADATVVAIFTGHLHTYLPYTIDNIPTYITGGGGLAQSGLAALTSHGHHFLLVRVTDGSLHAEVVDLD